MKARREKGIIKQGLPKYYKHWAGNFDTQPVEVHEKEGFFDLVLPDGFDEELQVLGDIFFDTENNYFTYPVLDIEIDLEAEKTTRKAELKQAVENELMAALGVGALEHLILDGAVPQSFKDIVINLRAWEAQIYAQIDAFTDEKEMKKFKIKEEDVNSAKETLKAGRKNI